MQNEYRNQFARNACRIEKRTLHAIIIYISDTTVLYLNKNQLHIQAAIFREIASFHLFYFSLIRVYMGIYSTFRSYLSQTYWEPGFESRPRVVKSHKSQQELTKFSHAINNFAHRSAADAIDTVVFASSSGRRSPNTCCTCRLEKMRSINAI